MPSDTNDLQVILAAQEKRDNSHNATSDVLKEMKSSLTSQFRWEELLQAAPTAISCIGACYVAGASPEVEVHLQSSNNGFKYLRHNLLRANLVECGELGRKAFITAERGMGAVNYTMKVVASKLNDILQVIGDPGSARKLLRPQLDGVRNGTATGLQEAKQQDKAFEEWLLHACELYAACVQQNGTAAETTQSNEISLAAEQARLANRDLNTDEGRRAMGLVDKQVEASSEAFKKAAAEFPTGWNTLGQQVVRDMVGAVTHFGNALTQALISDTALMPKNAADPAYAEALKIAHVLAILHVIVSGKNVGGNIDWEQTHNGGTSTDSNKTSIGYVTAMLDDAKTRFARVATESGPSKTLSTILDISFQVASGIKEQIQQKSGSASPEWPAKDSDQVKKWQVDFAAQYQEAIALISTARAVSGTPAHGIPLMTYSEEQTPQIKVDDVQGQAVLELAKNRLTTAQQTFNTVKDNHAKSTELLASQKNQLSQIQADLTKLTAANVSLAATKKILLSSIKTILLLKQQLTTLVRGLKALETTTEIIWKLHCEPFLSTIQQLLTSDNYTDPHKDLKIGQYTYTDLQSSQLFSAVLTLRAYSGVVGDIASMWNQLSKEAVMPGFHMCDRLSMIAGDGGRGGRGVSEEAKRFAGELNRWATDALERVLREAGERQREVREGVEERIREVDETLARIIPLPDVTVKAIGAGVDVTRQAVMTYSGEKAGSNPLGRFATIEA